MDVKSRENLFWVRVLACLLAVLPSAIMLSTNPFWLIKRGLVAPTYSSSSLWSNNAKETSNGFEAKDVLACCSFGSMGTYKKLHTHLISFKRILWKSVRLELRSSSCDERELTIKPWTQGISTIMDFFALDCSRYTLVQQVLSLLADACYVKSNLYFPDKTISELPQLHNLHFWAVHGWSRYNFADSVGISNWRFVTVFETFNQTVCFNLLVSS